MAKRALKKINQLSLEAASKELNHWLNTGHGQFKRVFQLRKRIDYLRHKPSVTQQSVQGLSLKAAIRFLRKGGNITLSEFVEFAKGRGLSKEYASDLFREAALRA